MRSIEPGRPAAVCCRALVGATDCGLLVRFVAATILVALTITAFAFVVAIRVAPLFAFAVAIASHVAIAAFAFVTVPVASHVAIVLFAVVAISGAIGEAGPVPFAVSRTIGTEAGPIAIAFAAFAVPITKNGRVDVEARAVAFAAASAAQFVHLEPQAGHLFAQPANDLQQFPIHRTQIGSAVRTRPIALAFEARPIPLAIFARPIAARAVTTQHLVNLSLDAIRLIVAARFRSGVHPPLELLNMLPHLRV